MAKKKPRARLQKPQSGAAKVRALKAKYPNATAKQLAQMAKVPLQVVYSTTSTDRKKSAGSNPKKAHIVRYTGKGPSNLELIEFVQKVGVERMRKVLDFMEGV